jgi:6-phospho-beta-glucosidase
VAPDDEGPGEAGYSAIAASFVRAVAGDRSETLILNAPNASRISALRREAVIEAPCRVADGTIEPLPLAPLPELERDLVVRIKEVERLTLRAAREGSATLALEAIAAHPVVPSREVARRILDGYLEQHRALRERLT